MRARTQIRSIRTQAKYGIPRLSNAFIKSSLKEIRERKRNEREADEQRAASPEAEAREE